MEFKCGFGCFHLFICAVLAGAGIITKYVCPGDSVQAFQNITFSKCNSVVSLYINDEGNTLIARWSFENCSQNETLLPEYNDRVFLYSNGTVSIHNVHPWDQGKYIFNCQMGNIFIEDVVQIQVMAAPASDCIPHILHQGSSLFVSLKAHSCGKPAATVYWKGYDFLAKTQPVLKLNPGNQDGTYYACIEGPALRCVRNELDYCSNLTIGDNKSPPILETCDTKSVIIIVVGIVSAVSSLILAKVVILIRKRCRQPTSTLLEVAVKNRQDNGNVHVTFGEYEGRTDAREVKDKNSVPGSSGAISISDDQSDDVPDANFIPLLQRDQYTQRHDDMLSNLEKHEILEELYDAIKQKFDLKKEKERWIKYVEMLSNLEKHEILEELYDTINQKFVLKKEKERWIKYVEMLSNLEKHEILEELYDTINQKFVLKKEKERWIKYVDMLSNLEKHEILEALYDAIKQKFVLKKEKSDG